MNYLNAVLDVAGYRWAIKYVGYQKPITGIRSKGSLTAIRFTPHERHLRLTWGKGLDYHDATPDAKMTLPCFTFADLTAHETTELLCQVVAQIGEPDFAPLAI